MENKEFKDKLVSINRITKVVKGGRRFAFSALVVVGNYAGSIGVGYAKAKQVPDAIKKATQKAKGNLIKIHLREGRTLHHDIFAKDGAGKVLLRSAPSNQRSPRTSALLGSRSMAPRAETDFPEPDSPTMAKVSPALTVSDSASTTTLPSKATVSSLSCSSGLAVGSDMRRFLDRGLLDRSRTLFNMAWVEGVA